MRTPSLFDLSTYLRCPIKVCEAKMNVWQMDVTGMEDYGPFRVSLKAACGAHELIMSMDEVKIKELYKALRDEEFARFTEGIR